MSDEQQQQQTDTAERPNGDGIQVTDQDANLPALAKGARNVQMGEQGLVPKDFLEMWQIAATLAKSDLVPKDYKGKPANVFVALEMGHELGLPMMFAVQNIAVINGRGSMWGDAMLAMVDNSGLLMDMEERFEGEFPTDGFRAICMTVRAGDRTGRKPRTVVREFSMADAKAAGLYPGKEDSAWKKYPKRMLQMRARGFNLRDNFSDRLKGLMLQEELEAIDITPTPGNQPPEPDPLQEKLDAAKNKTHPLAPAAPAAEQPKDAKPAVSQALGEAIEQVNALITRMNQEITPGAGLEALRQKTKQGNLQGLSVEKLHEVAKYMEEALTVAAKAKQSPEKAAACICTDPEVGDPDCKAEKHTPTKRGSTRKLV